MGIVGRTAVALAIFVIVAFTISHAVMAHEMLDGDTPFAQVSFASWVAGVLGGAVAAVLVGIGLKAMRR